MSIASASRSLATISNGLARHPVRVGRPSDRLAASFARADPDALVHRQHEDLAIADFTFVARAAPLHDRRNRRLDEVVVDGNLELDLAEQVDRNLMATVGLGVAPLPAEALLDLALWD